MKPDRITWWRRSLWTLLFTMLAVTSAQAEPGVTQKKVVLGMSAPLTGPFAYFGTELERGLKLGLAGVNASGGVAGREIELLVKDDASQPQRALENTRALIDAGVFALTGYQGASSIAAVLPVIAERSIPLLGAANGAEFLREPLHRFVFNFRAGARDEAAAMVLHLDTVGLTETAVVAQDDALGQAGLDGVQFELTRLAMRPSTVVRLAVDASTVQVAQAVQSACRNRPQGLILVLDARNALAFIRAARGASCTSRVYLTSEAGSQLLSSRALNADLGGVIVAQVIPYPHVASLPLVADFLRLSGTTGAPSYPALEGFVYAKVAAEALRRCGRELTRECVVAALESKPVDAGGYRVQFGPTDRRGSRFVEMTIVSSEGKFRR